MKVSQLLITSLLGLALTFPTAAQEGAKITDEAPGPPEIFDDLDDAKAAAKERSAHIVIVCLKENDPNSIALGKMIEENSIYLNPEELVVFRYRVDDDARIETFRSHFGVNTGDLPIFVLTDAWGDPLGHLTGLSQKGAYTAWVRDTGNKDLVKIPADGLFNIKAETLVTTKDIIDAREWTLISGKRFNAALVEANGSKGTFRTLDDDFIEIDFNHLTQADKAYLSKHLPKTGSTTFP
ncbi:MAG: hypothetical protein AAGD22_13600 [Verrucomicrobiota bacterium]